jgi:hypothetical protein
LSQQSNIFGHKPKLDGIVKNDFLIVLLNIISHNHDNNREVLNKNNSIDQSLYITRRNLALPAVETIILQRKSWVKQQPRAIHTKAILIKHEKK